MLFIPINNVFGFDKWARATKNYTFNPSVLIRMYSYNIYEIYL